MSNRWLRFVIALLAIAAAVAAGFRISRLEQQLVSDVTRSRAGESAAQTALESLGDLKAALHAYVAPGQNHTFWTARVGMFVDKVRSALLELDGAATSAGAPVTDTLSTLDKLGASEQRARNYLVTGQSLMAGDVIFTEGRDLMDGMRMQIAHARAEVGNAAATRQTELRREQLLLALAGVGILALAVLVLVPPVRAPETSIAPEAVEAGSSEPATSEEAEYARVISRTPNPAGAAAPAARPATANAGAATSASASTGPGAGAKPGAPASRSKTARTAPAAPSQPEQKEPPAPPVAAPAPAPLPSPVPWADAAAVCVDLARLSDSNDISALLERAARVLNASGIVVWMASEDRQELFPAAAAGYDERLFSRIGSIPRDASNLTAAAFRDVASRTRAGADSAGAALAVPLITPDGPVGVFSAELKSMQQVDDTRLAVATIFAAQLSTLLGSMTVATPAAAAAPPQTAQGR